MPDLSARFNVKATQDYFNACQTGSKFPRSSVLTLPTMPWQSSQTAREKASGLIVMLPVPAHPSGASLAEALQLNPVG